MFSSAIVPPVKKPGVDSVALTYSDVGIAMRHGPEVTHESAHVVQMEDSMWKLVQAIEVSRGAVGLVKQNYGIRGPMIGSGDRALKDLAVVAGRRDHRRCPVVRRTQSLRCRKSWPSNCSVRMPPRFVALATFCCVIPDASASINAPMVQSTIRPNV